MPAAASAFCSRAELAHAYSLPRTPRRWRTSRSSFTLAARSASRNSSSVEPYTPIVTTERTAGSSHRVEGVTEPVATVDAVYEERYWYPEDGGQVWLVGYQLVEAESARYLARDAPELAARGLRTAGVAGAGQHHAEALQTDAAAPGEPLDLRRDPDNEY